MSCDSSFISKINRILNEIYPSFLSKYSEIKDATVPIAEINASRDIAVAKATSASASASASELKMWRAEAERRTADSFRSTPANTYVQIYTSKGDGTFSVETIPSFSALHYKQKAEEATALIAEGATAFLPFTFADGHSENIKVIEIGSNSYIPFILSDGTNANIQVLGEE